MRCEKSRLPSFAWVVAVAGLLLLSACQTITGQDSGGRGVQVTEWKVVDVSEVDLNLPLLIPVKVTKAEYQSRDNAINHYRMRLDGYKGLISTQRIPDGFYSDRTREEFADVEAFKAGILRYLKEDFTGFGEIRPVKHRNAHTVGFAALVNVTSSAKDKCFFAKVAYRMAGQTRFHNDTGNPDSLVRVRYCDPQVKFDAFLRAMEKADWVSDHTAFAAALAAK